MTSYKRLYEVMKKEYKKLQSSSIDLRKANLRIYFSRDKWDWKEDESGNLFIIRKEVKE